MRILKKIYHALLNVYLAFRRRPYIKEIKKFVSVDTSIVSSNCFAGRIMQDLGMQYNTPTLGLWILPSDFAPFCTNLKKYLMSDIFPTSISKTEVGNYKMTHAKHPYPVGVCGKDIEIHFLHYPSIQEGAEKWKRRSSRFNYDNYILIGCEQNGCTEDDIKAFDEIPYEKKLFFTSKKYPYLSTVFIPEFASLGHVGDPYKKSYIYYKYLVEWMRTHLEIRK